MTRAQKRVAVAKDVLLQLSESRVKASSGVWFSVYDGLTVGKQLQEELTKVDCIVCALGGLFVGCVNLFNDFTVSRHLKKFGSLDRDDLLVKVGKLFSKKQIDLIEVAFERHAYGWNHNLSKKETERALSFNYNNVNADDRMRAIMNNIIKNNGQFVP